MSKIPSYNELLRLSSLTDVVYERNRSVRLPRWKEVVLVSAPEDFLTVQENIIGNKGVADINIYKFCNDLRKDHDMKLKIYTRLSISYNINKFNLYDHIGITFNNYADDIVECLRECNYSKFRMLFLECANVDNWMANVIYKASRWECDDPNKAYDTYTKDDYLVVEQEQ